jgi:CRISPR-associated protein Cas1
MAWKGLHIAKPGRLSFGDGQIVVAQADGEARLPLEDIGWIVLDEPRLTLTAALLAALAEQGIALITTDRRHMPSALTLPFARHHRLAGVVAQQIGLGTPFKKRCWQMIVRAKLNNQARVLDFCERGQGEPLRGMAKRVGSGDPDNIEARGARHYWGGLFDGFTRDDPSDLRNKMLNYGYAILRGGVARALTGAGFVCAIGLHHASQSNAFNLADDLIEPFRPFADRMTALQCRARDVSGDLTLDDRRGLTGLLLETCEIAGEKMTLLVGCERVAASLQRAIEQDEPSRLTLPTLASGAADASMQGSLLDKAKQDERRDKEAE